MPLKQPQLLVTLLKTLPKARTWSQKKPLIKKKMREYVEKKLEELDITYEWKLGILKDVIERCAKGDATREGILHPSGIVSAVQELNKMQGHYKPEQIEQTNTHLISENEKLFLKLLEDHQKPY